MARTRRSRPLATRRPSTTRGRPADCVALAGFFAALAVSGPAPLLLRRRANFKAHVWLLLVACRRAGGAPQGWPRNSCKGLRARHCAMSCSRSCSPMGTLTAATPFGVGDAVAQHRRLASALQQRGRQGLKSAAMMGAVARHHRRRLRRRSESAPLMDTAAARHQRRGCRSEAGATMMTMGPAAAWHQRQHDCLWRHRRRHRRGSELAAAIRASTAALEAEVGEEARAGRGQRERSPAAGAGRSRRRRRSGVAFFSSRREKARWKSWRRPSSAIRGAS